MKKKKKLSLGKINWRNRFAELLVVFLGVTAGFVLQNQKEQYHFKTLKQSYIQGFINDVDQNISIIENNIETDSIWLSNTKYAIFHLKDSKLNYDSATTIVKQMVNFYELSVQDDTYQEIISSGNLNLFSDFKLRKEIIVYHNSLDDYKILDEYFKEYITNHFLPWLLSEYSLFNQEFISKDSHRGLEFQNHFGTYFSLVQQRMTAQKGLLIESREMKIALNNY